MGLKNKLNEAYVTGCLIMAGLLGLVSQSWNVFLVALILSFGICMFTRKIRH